MINLASRKHRFLASSLSGLLLILSFPFIGNLIPLIFIAWVPLLFIEAEIHDKSYRSNKVFIHAYITFFLFNAGTTWWVWNASPGGAALAIILNSLLMALTFQAFHLTKKYVGKKEGYLALLIFWISFEYLHHNWEMSWTWISLGNVFSIVPSWVQWYSYTGILGGSFWILVINIFTFKILRNVFSKKESWRIQTPLIWLASLFLLLPIGLSIISYSLYIEKTDPVEVVAIQPNVDPYNEKFDKEALPNQLKKIDSLARLVTTETTDLIIAPETAISSVYSFDEETIETSFPFKEVQKSKRKLWNIPWYTGVSTVRYFDKQHSRASKKLKGGPGFIEYYNSSMLLDEQDAPHFIHKSKLVPGVEIIPFSNYLPFLETLSIDNGGTTGSLGVEKRPKVFQTKKITFAPVICYESVYGEWVAEQCRQGASLICIATNDGWWGNTPGYKQHMSFARLRAIENRRCVARSANTGYSCFINQRGDVIQQTKWWEPTAIRAIVNLNKETTFYTTYGNVMGRSFAFVAILLLLFTFVKRFKKLVSK